MRIRMDKPGHHAARRTFAAGIPVLSVAAIQILDIGQCQGQRPAAFILIQKDCMPDPAGISHGNQRFLQLAVTGNVREFHYLSRFAT